MGSPISDAVNLPKGPPTRGGGGDTRVLTDALGKMTAPNPDGSPPAATTAPVAATGGASSGVVPGAILPGATPSVPTPEGAGGVVPLPSLPKVGGDQFNSELRGAAKTVIDQIGIGLPPELEDLLPDLTALASLGDLPQRFLGDLALLRDQLLSPKLTPDDRADRLLNFFAAYAERFVAIASGEAHVFVPERPIDLIKQRLVGDALHVDEPQLTYLPPHSKPVERPSAEERSRAKNQFEEALAQSGLERLEDKRSGKDGAQVCSQLLDSKDTKELKQQLQDAKLLPRGNQDAPTPAAEAKAQSVSEALPRELSRPGNSTDTVKVQPWAAEAGRVVVQSQTADDSSMDRRHRRGTDKVLGRNMLWNVLHRFRGEDEESVLQKDERDKLAYAAIGVLFAIAVVAILLITL